ncbi:MAG TPA: universal stress protein [Verrucomicrobiae bacterium]|jgi:two-component system sensor histidine kinase KdpD|nr:universal stress protein [Verrucomicrobiae bacterium]
MLKTPEQWLEVAAPERKRGVFKLFLGYAPGVGKTYSMLSEAIRRKSRGEDVVIGVIETHGRAATKELAGRLETVPRRKIDYKGTIFEEMDVDAILARKPQVALIDELAHTNIDGSRHYKRYEDVFDLLDNQIDVLSTMNVQHLESVTPLVHKITGIVVRETVPDWVLKRVDEIVLADVTPEALQTRMRRGDIYPMERVDRALGNFFRPSNLIALREIALRHVAQVVDRSLEPYIQSEMDPGRELQVSERIAVGISSNPAAQYLVARAARMAQAVSGELYVVYVDIGRDDDPEHKRSLEANFRFSENLGAQVVRLKAKKVASAMAEFVREKHITQVIFGHSATSGWRRYLFLSAVHRFLRDAPAVDVHIVKQQVD